MADTTLRDRILSVLGDVPQPAIVIADTADVPTAERQRVQPMLNRLAHAGFASVSYRGRGLKKRALYAKAVCNERSVYCYRVESRSGAVEIAVGADFFCAGWMGSTLRRRVTDATGTIVGSYLLRYVSKQRVAA